MNYYVEFGGGLGDIFFQLYTSGLYNALERLEDGEGATIALVTHNPFASELFQCHPQRARLDVRLPGYWLPEDDGPNRRRHGLPPHAAALYRHDLRPQHGPVTFYPSEDDLQVIRDVLDVQASQSAPIIVFAVSAGEPYKSFPAPLVPRIVARVKAAGALPVFVGRTYERFDREELRGPWLADGIDAIDRLTVPGTARLVQEAAGVVCCHSSVNMLAWMERKPQLLLYPRALYDTFIQPRTLWAVGIDYPETVHGVFETYGEFMMERFLMRVESGKQLAPGRLVTRRDDVREFLRALPVTRNPVNGEDYTQADWFTAENGYPFYARAAELLRPSSVLEIGALLGFGLAAFVHGHPDVQKVTVVDNESYIPRSQTLCEQNLAFYGGRKRFGRSLEDARGRHDLIHVDADHSFAGALHDVAFAWGLGPRVMLVDDFLFLEDVRRAVDAFATHQELPYKVWTSYRGWAVFARADTFAQLPDNL